MCLVTTVAFLICFRFLWRVLKPCKAYLVLKGFRFTKHTELLIDFHLLILGEWLYFYFLRLLTTNYVSTTHWISDILIHYLVQLLFSFNQLDLPEYTSKEQLQDRLLLAIHEASEGFGFGWPVFYAMFLYSSSAIVSDVSSKG
jgi:hypothetical protein